ncbi:hypothetical protein AAX29_01837 [Aliarcobacter thereius]|uniref:DUF4190 domain-containing protein n=1 Tax=Aliarcobacter thereius TaxID=544718 RepID=A0A1C0B586_9BACT|nr:hypothetical protein [Aliarcobacter thereius]OCL97684.1 hypothetical protein AAX29_01837 [Aliarcobacter thereius]
MGMCQGCKVVYSALIMKDGYCKDCKPEWFDTKGEPTKENVNNNVETIKEEVKDNQALGIVSFVLSIITFLTGGVIGIIFAIISIICGSGAHKNTFGVVGIIISSIYLLIIFLSLMGIASIMALN